MIFLPASFRTASRAMQADGQARTQRSQAMHSSIWKVSIPRNRSGTVAFTLGYWMVTFGWNIYFRVTIRPFRSAVESFHTVLKYSIIRAYYTSRVTFKELGCGSTRKSGNREEAPWC